LPIKVGPGPWTEEGCPGWYVAQPQIIEASRGALALKHNALDLYFPTKPAALLEAAMELLSAYQQYEAHVIRENAKKR
jgi:hypothetical protein